MAPESCNFGKDEAEILKPSSPSPSSSSSTSSQSNPPPPSLPLPASSVSLFQDFSAQRSEIPETAASAAKDLSFEKLEKESRSPALLAKRCSTCRKKLGLTGFRCRCGDLFCGRHRYSDTHDCSYDYKAAGREEISKANPVIRAAKIIKI